MFERSGFQDLIVSAMIEFLKPYIPWESLRFLIS